jgi:hypothetical protein
VKRIGESLLTLSLSGLVAAASLSSCRDARAKCFTPSDQTAGWKVVAIPDDAPGLAADEPIEQFRAGEPALVWLDRGQGSMSLGSRHHGKLEYLFRHDGLPGSWQVLELSLSRSLTGDKVDVIAHTPAGLVPLWLERRETGSALRFEWAHDQVYAVTVRIHHHLREHAVVTDWRAGVRMNVSQAPWIPASFRAPRSLYYLHPGGRTVLLCDTSPWPIPRAMVVQRLSLLGTTPVPVRLTRP